MIPTKTNRRRFFHQSIGGTLGSLAGLSAIPLLNAAPNRHDGPARLRLSLAAYSFRQFFKLGRGKPNTRVAPELQIDLYDFIDYCSNMGLSGTELTSYYFVDTGRDNLLRMKHHAFMRGITISGTAVGNNFCLPKGSARTDQITSVKRWIDRAFLLGAPHIRIFAGSAGQLSHLEAKNLCIEAIEECCDYAADYGIMLGLENHGGIVAEADDLLDILRQVDSPWLGINLDTGNFHTEDPYADIERCAPYAVNAQVKVEISAKNQPRGPADLARIVEILRRARYQGFVVLEYEAQTDPWKAVPGYLHTLEQLFHG